MKIVSNIINSVKREKNKLELKNIFVKSTIVFN